MLLCVRRFLSLLLVHSLQCSVLIGCETILYCTTRPLNYFDEAKKLDAEIARQAKKATKARVMANNENNGITEMTV